MNADLDKVLAGRWTEYLRLASAGAIYAAVIRLAEIANCVRGAGIPPELVSKWISMVREVDIAPGELRSIRAEASQRAQRIRRLVDVGGNLNYEEILLVITLGTELDLLSHFLVERGDSDLLDVDHLEEALSATVSSPSNVSTFHSAQLSAKVNWGLPLRSRWLGNDASQ